VTNYLLDKYDALQFPVFPMMRMPTFRNFFKNITTGTYADEFAENHFSTMVSRYTSNAFVPSAGTGFVLSKRTLDMFGDEDVLPKDSLTEDYRLSLTLYQKGISMYYVLERVPRINRDGKLVWDFITTRSIFPSTFKTAVKQKTRWILGITMQSFRFKDIFKMEGIRLSGRYSLYKDLKAKVGNMLVMVGYPVLIYFFVSSFIPLDPIYPKGTLSWYFCLIVTIMMIERQIFRSVAIYNVYGLRSVFFACFFPPLLPIRLVWGNIINMTATAKAYKQKAFGNDTKKKEKKKNEKVKEKKLAWAKTDHEFIESAVLKNYHRTVGDYLLQRGYIDPEQLQKGLKESKKNNQIIGNYFLENDLITEEQLLDVLSEVKHIQYVRSNNLEDYQLQQFAEIFEKEFLTRMNILPIMEIPDGYVIAFSDKSPNNVQTLLREKYHIDVKPAFMPSEKVVEGIEIMYSTKSESEKASSILSKLSESGQINYEQALIARNYHYLLGIPEEETLARMGLYGRTQHMREITNINVDEKIGMAVATEPV
jgi:adsorption protein B